MPELDLKINETTGEAVLITELLAAPPVHLPDRFLAHWENFVFHAAQGINDPGITPPIWAMLNAHFKGLVK